MTGFQCILQHNNDDRHILIHSDDTVDFLPAGTSLFTLVMVFACMSSKVQDRVLLH